jgi:hypothetical protein
MDKKDPYWLRMLTISSSVALMGVIHPGDRQSSAMTRYEKMPAPISRAGSPDE